LFAAPSLYAEVVNLNKSEKKTSDSETDKQGPLIRKASLSEYQTSYGQKPEHFQSRIPTVAANTGLHWQLVAGSGSGADTPST
jgi:hypothetical protein